MIYDRKYPSTHLKLLLGLKCPLTYLPLNPAQYSDENNESESKNIESLFMNGPLFKNIMA